MEQLCCLFPTLQLSAAGNQAHRVLTLTGPEGAKPLIEAEPRTEENRCSTNFPMVILLVGTMDGRV